MQSNIIIYQNKEGSIKIDVRLEDKTVWLTQQQMATLFQSSRTNVVEHINIFTKKENCSKKQLFGISKQYKVNQLFEKIG